MVDEENNVFQREPERKKRKPGGRNNARKHGGFAQDLANENGEEFRQLHESLIAEWNPDPGTEEHAVLYLAQSIWVQRRVDRYHRREMALAKQCPVTNDRDQTLPLARSLKVADNEVVANRIIGLLPKKYRKWITRRVPRIKYHDAGSWIKALRLAMEHILECLATAEVYELNSLEFKIKRAARVRELMEAKIKLDERLGSRIDKAIKRIAQLKAVKQVMGMNIPHEVKVIEHHAAPDPGQ